MTITASVTFRSILLVATWLFVGNGIEHGVVKLVSYVLITPKNKYAKIHFNLWKAMSKVVHKICHRLLLHILERLSLTSATPACFHLLGDPLVTAW